MISRRGACLALGASIAPGQASVRAQGRYPERPVTLVVPFAPGGVADITARAFAEAMAARLGQAVVVDNKPGAGGIVAAQAVTGARPDGHTLLLMSNANAVSVGLFRKLPYDPVRDFAPVSTLAFFDLGIFVAAGSRFATLAELIAFGRAQPGKLNIGTIVVGSSQHLAAKLFERAAGVEAVVVPYKATPAVINALRAGEVDAAFEIVAPVLPQLGAGGPLRALAVTGAHRNPALPGVPTAAQAGLANYEVASWNAIAAPAATPPAALESLNRAVHEAAAAPALRERLATQGVRVQPGSPAELSALLGREIRRWGEVIRAARIEPE